MTMPFEHFVKKIDLKSKEPRLRDWNSWRTTVTVSLSWLEIKRTSITRLKRRYGTHANRESSLEIKRTSITRLKLIMMQAISQPSATWNQKNLDYEIETNRKSDVNGWLLLLEIKRTSITRLKRAVNDVQMCNRKRHCLEIKRTSITRLKQLWRCGGSITSARLKSKEPRLRDWNKIRGDQQKSIQKDLKSKEPRLRDWNDFTNATWIDDLALEIKRTSITRLKQSWGTARASWGRLEIKRTSITRLKHKPDRPRCERFRLKSKEPRLRDWNLRLQSVLSITNYGSWNQKNLDYEIETGGKIVRWRMASNSLKSKEPRLRDWN